MILGITGAFGCGKSAVRAVFSASPRWEVADADALCHQLYADPAGELAGAIRERWGPAVIAADGSVNRAAVGKIVFADPAELEFLNKMLHPLVIREVERRIAECRFAGKHGAFEIPLLYEAGFADRFDAVAAVWAAPEIRHARLARLRGFTPEEIRRREARQLSPDLKLERADYALINNGSREELELQTKNLIHQLEDL